MPPLPHTAISSCSGYIYQGKIAVIHCLKLFEELGEGARTLELEIESLDDFAILSADGNYRSMHQVKAKKSLLFSGYREALEKQQRDSIGNNNVPAFFHVAKSINDIPIDFDINFEPVQFYKYSNHDGQEVDACELDQVDTLNEAQAKRAYISLGQEPYKYNDADYLIKTRQYLEDIVVKHIIEVHHKIIEERKRGRSDRQIAMENKIKLEDFYDLLVNKNLNAITEGDDYFHYLLLKDAGKYFHDYCLDELEDEPEVLLKLNSYLSIINSLNIPQLTKFIQLILPHKKATFKFIHQYKDNTFNHLDFKYGLLSVFHELIESDNDSELSFFWEKNGDTYYPTAISVDQRQASRLCTDIVQSALDNDVDFFFESGKLINQGIDRESIFSNVQVGKLSLPEEQDELNHHRINSFRNISLISLDNAKGIINE
ncbi:MAG: hypothetical protein ACJAXS_002541 [Colwellia sp.]|jgi:hypothetical protein